MSLSEPEFRFSHLGPIPLNNPDFWERVCALFDRVLDSSTPDIILAAETDSAVATAARALWQQHLEALRDEFLDVPALDVRQFLAGDPPVFAAEQLLAGRFRIERLLGKGGMGEVYLAHDERLAEPVALKTMLADLAAEATFRDQFVREIRSARRVTHANVCRIFDVFDEGAVPFYTMEYLAGTTLTEWLADAPANTPQRREIALALAGALHAAHEQGIIHRDFKPANVIVLNDGRPVITDFGLARPIGADGDLPHPSLGAGTARYMAPELSVGHPAGIASDVYAFGAVLNELLPGIPIAEECLASEAERRPRSMKAVLEQLEPGMPSRRTLMSIAAIGAAGAGAAGWYFRRPAYPLAAQQRLIFNGLRSTLDDATQYGLRELLLTALRQSPLLRIIPDARVRALLRQGRRPPALPAPLADLFVAAELDQVPLILESSARLLKSGLRLAVQLFPAGGRQPALTIEHEAENPTHLVRLAELVASELRQELGESGGSLKANIPLEQITSPSPEAVQFYYRAVRAQDKNDLDAALAYLDEALRHDPEFAIAHHYRAATLVSLARLKDSVAPSERGFALRSKLHERERNWIESQYFMRAGDPLRALSGSRRNAALYPDEPAYQRQTAAAHARLAQFPEALQFAKRALELDPFNDNNLSEWIVTLAEANRGEEALAAYAEFRRQGYTTTLLDWGAGMAYLNLGQYESAAAAFARMGSAAARQRWAARLATIPDILQGHWPRVIRTLTADLALDDATKDQENRHIRRLWLAELWWLRDDPAQAAAVLGELPPLLEPHAINLNFFHAGGALAARLGAASLVSAFSQPLVEIDRQWTSPQSQGALAHVRGLAAEDVAELRRAKALWPHPPILLSCGAAELLADPTAALATFEQLDRLRGKTFKHYFPGIAVQGWRLQAKTLAALSRFADASRLYKQVTAHWGGPESASAWQRSALNDYRHLKKQLGET